MKTVFMICLSLLALPALAQECNIIVLGNGRPADVLTGQASLKKCLEKAAVTLDDIPGDLNPTVIVSHSDLSEEVFMRKKDGLVIDPDL